MGFFELDRVDPLGQPIDPTAINKFNAVNSVLLNAGKSIVDVPPTVLPDELICSPDFQDEGAFWCHVSTLLWFLLESSVVEFKCAGDFSDYSFSDGECHVDTDGFSNSITPAESDYKLVAYYNDVEYVTPGDIVFLVGMRLQIKPFQCILS